MYVQRWNESMCQTGRAEWHHRLFQTLPHCGMERQSNKTVKTKQSQFEEWAFLNPKSFFIIKVAAVIPCGHIIHNIGAMEGEQKPGANDVIPN